MFRDPDGGFSICERGISAPSGDADALAAGMSLLINDEALRREIGERGLQFVSGHYSKDRLLDDIRALYADLLSGMNAAKATSVDENVHSRA